MNVDGEAFGNARRQKELGDLALVTEDENDEPRP